MFNDEGITGRFYYGMEHISSGVLYERQKYGPEFPPNQVRVKVCFPLGPANKYEYVRVPIIWSESHSVTDLIERAFEWLKDKSRTRKFSVQEGFRTRDHSIVWDGEPRLVDLDESDIENILGNIRRGGAKVLLDQREASSTVQ